MDSHIRNFIDSNTRKKYLARFPTNKYVTFTCCIQNIYLPSDVVKCILNIMINTDKIHIRLLITEIILSVFKIDALNIYFPKEGDLSYEEIHEAMLLKMFKITLQSFTRRQQRDIFHPFMVFGDKWWQNRVVERTTIHKRKCISCSRQTCGLTNNVIICKMCKNILHGTFMRDIVTKYCKDILLLSFYNILPPLDEFEKLIPLTYYNYLEYEFSKEKSFGKELMFVSKKIQEERINAIILAKLQRIKFFHDRAIMRDNKNRVRDLRTIEYNQKFCNVPFDLKIKQHKLFELNQFKYYKNNIIKENKAIKYIDNKF